jgi:general secretion pathway protein A
MYERFFGLQCKPFALTPDPAFLYLSRQHAMALTLLEYGLESQASFALLTGSIGSGKTTLLRRLLRDAGSRVAIGLVSNTHRSFDSIHSWILSALGAHAAADTPTGRYEAIEGFVVREYAAGRRTMLVFDEAQNLTPELLEELRLLSNINSEQDLVLQIVLVGQPELRSTLCSQSLRQLAQRIGVDFHLRGLDVTETIAYVRHRMSVAGAEREVFTDAAMEIVHRHTRGIPRLINHLCDLSLVYGYADSMSTLDATVIELVLRDRAKGLALPIFNQRSEAARALG